jgi:uncharacterized protein with FMN-binding domain
MKKIFNAIRNAFLCIPALIVANESYKDGLYEDYADAVEERTARMKDGTWSAENEDYFRRLQSKALKALGKRKVAEIDLEWGC